MSERPDDESVPEWESADELFEERDDEDGDVFDDAPWSPPAPRAPDPWLPQRVRTREKVKRTLDQFIARFTDADPIYDRDEHVVIFEASGYFMSGDIYMATRAMGQYLPEGFHEVERWGNGFRAVWTNEAVGATITYCEGDVSVAIARSRLHWIEYRDETEKFYLLNP